VTQAIAVAALSARMMAESARRGGFDVIALDVFGDADTRRAARAWSCVGAPDPPRLDSDATAAAMARLRTVAGCIGWVAGAGFEGSPSLLARCAAVARLIGNATETMRSVRDPATFFARLAAMGIAYPEIAWTRPVEPGGWLRKDARGSGGWHIRPVQLGDPRHPDAPPHVYFQRRREGRSMSALFLADGRDARLLGINELIVEPLRSLPFVYRGAIGPLTLTPRITRDIDEAVRAIVREWRLVGLNSLDFLLDGEGIFVLEVNPRPSASMALHDDVVPRGLMRTHVDACLAGSLPTTMTERAAGCRGYSIVFAEASLRFPSAMGERWLDLRWCHDIPMPGESIAEGGPVCSVSARGRSASEVRAELATRGRQVLALLASSTRAPLPETSR
jgi:predicted ATP-grasp superfamily ATP-dependent carboligase